MDYDYLLKKIDQLDEKILSRLAHRSMLLTQDWTTGEIKTLCQLIEFFEEADREGCSFPLFPDELAYALFFDGSTRTKSSWAGAAARLGAHPVIVDGSTTQVAHGETAEETGAMLGMNAHAMGIRHDLILGEGNRFMRDAKKGIDDYLKSVGSQRAVPIVNLQCDIDHPTQTLADLCWLREKFPKGLSGRTIAVSWAYSPSYAKPLSVPQGLITLLTRFGMNVRLAHPEGYGLMPECLDTAQSNAKAAGGSFVQSNVMDEVFSEADIVYPKSWGPYDLMLERVEANRRKDHEGLRRIEAAALERNALHTDWICDERRMKSTAKGGALYMHCLPADIGAEVSRGVLERFRFDLAREANKKVYAIMALLAAAKEPDLKELLTEYLAALSSDI
ncbi:MAG: knotted carbamoyltransferase YgeW [Candidatus Eisenbacteria bacterium]|uniref:Knotted carbamoyltransferase YgeW n=1 Tax=Eiseniibacteriota bacterium TaxID=2212470 RepID=A0A948WDP9_UNCEI|nr:knotted carbamoyltransferase YgeW [Candidatus Eisenbacteria bacterium]MBU1947338.1 knotted carbamoyltransferase YgeW [Candidatus Eisenbacteria bacterium]MBU2692063.1 knotted carbamoyltransferase YgeW [Candidatus Eisenbacteria bacterium]